MAMDTKMQVEDEKFFNLQDGEYDIDVYCIIVYISIQSFLRTIFTPQFCRPSSQES